MTIAAVAWGAEPATSTGASRYGFEEIPTMERSRAESGKTIVLCALMGPGTTVGPDRAMAVHGTSVVVACKAKGARQPDVLKGKIAFPDSFFDPLPEDELVAWEGQ